jgi:hypothetical protein
MAIEQLKVREIVKRAVGKELDIPEFQREFVWDPEQATLLAESLYRDYPVGSFLLWDSSEYQEAKAAQGAQASLWIVDGQQRTTALCLLLGEKPYWWPDKDSWNKALQRYDVMMNLDQGQEERPQFGLPNPIRRQSAHWINVREVLCKEDVEALSQFAQDVAKRIDSEAGLDLFTHIHARLQRLWQLRERDIPIIKVGHEVEDVAEIFARLNQAGTRVKEADVVLALAAARNPGWVREAYLPFVDDLENRGWDLEAGIFVRTMTGVGHGRARLIEVPKTFWSPDALPAVWKKTSGVIAEVTRRLAEYGILSSALLPSANALIPLFVLHDKWGSAGSYDFRKALYWFLLASRDGRYSGSAITTLNEDVRAIKDAPSFEDALAVLLERLQASPEVAPDEFLLRYDRAGNRFLRLALYLAVYDASGRDWVEKTRIAYDKAGAAVIAGFMPHWHHIFPKSLLRNAGVSPDDINMLANITVMNEKTNVRKLQAKPPWKYIDEYRIEATELRNHAIPDGWADEVGEETWAIANYPSFVVDRAAELAERVTAFLSDLRAGAGQIPEPVTTDVPEPVTTDVA